MYYLIFFGWVVSATLLQASPLLNCVETREDGVAKQLSIVANSRGTYDVAIALDDGNHRLRYLAIDLECSRDDKLPLFCVSAPSSPHVGSRVLAAEVAGGNRQQFLVVIDSPLTEQPFLLERCAVSYLRLPVTVPPTKGNCLAYFQGAYYSPDLGNCVSDQTSGCRNPYPYSDINECRGAMHLPTKP